MADLDMGIGRRLALGFGAVLALMLASLGVFVFGIYQQAEATSRLTDLIMPRADAANDLKSAYLQQSAGMRAYVLSGDGRFLSDYRAGVDAASGAMSVLERLPRSAEGAVLFDQMRPLASLYHQQADRAISLREQGRVEEADQMLLGDLYPIRTDLESKADSFVDLQSRLRDEARDELARSQADAVRNSAAIALLALLLGAILAYRTATSVRKPVRGLVLASEQLASGDYPAAMTLAEGVAGPGLESADELKQLARRFRLAAEGLFLRERRLSAHSALSVVLASTTEVEELGEESIRVIAEHVGAEMGAVYGYDAERDLLIRQASYCLGNGIEETVAPKDGIVGEAAYGKRTIVLQDIPSDLPFRIRLGVDDLPPRWVAAVPMVVEAEVIGVLLLAGLRGLSQDAQAFLQSGAGQIAVSLQNALAHERIAAQNELLQTQNEEIQTQNEEIQTQTEEIQAQNEELQTQYEELQAQNEEIQTQYEEIQTQNEELEIQNQELLELGRELSRSRELLAEAERLSRSGAWEWDMSAGEWEFSEGWTRVHGTTGQKLSTPEFLSIAHPDDQPTVDRALADALAGKKPYDIEHRIIRQDTGEVRRVRAVGEVERDESGNPVKMRGFVQDVSDRKAAEAALRESEERLLEQAELLDLAHVLIRDANDCITTWNSGAQALYGFTKEEAIGRVSHDLFATVFPESRQVVAETLARDGRWEGELVHTAKDGRKVVVASHQVLHRSRDGRPTAVVEVNNDITEQKRAEAALRESEERLLTMANAIPQLAWMAQPDGYIYWYNQRWYQYTGTTPEEMEGWGWQSVHDPEMLPAVLERWRASIATGQPFDMEFPLKGADGRFRWFLTRVMPLKDQEGRVLHWFGTNTDISQRREAEAERESLLLAEQKARSLAEMAVKARDEFISIAAHELKTPLTSLRGFSQIMLREMDKKGSVDTARLARSMERIEEQSRRLSALTEQLLNVSRLETGKMRLALEETDVAALVEGVISSVRHAHPQRVVELRNGSPVSACVDPLRMEQVVTNLIDNALKFSPAHTPIEVEVDRDSTGWVRIAVRDHGIGIPEDKRERVFERFFQAHPERHFGGMGIGLFVSKQIADMHGGTIALERPEDGGSCFVVRIPSSEVDTLQTQ